MDMWLFSHKGGMGLALVSVHLAPELATPPFAPCARSRFGRFVFFRQPFEGAGPAAGFGKPG